MRKRGFAVDKCEYRRKKKKKQDLRTLIFVFVIVFVFFGLEALVGWFSGIGSWMDEMKKPVVKELDLSGINSPYASLIQARNGRAVGEINGEQKMYPASLTKMMTCLVAIEEIRNLNREITLTQEMFAGLYEQNATQAGFQPGETVRVIDLLYGVILPSGAECCIALADTIAGSEQGFVDLMNKKADKLGMDDTHFMNSTGLHDPEHYSTARDMAVLLEQGLKNETFREIIESPWHSTPGTNIHPDGITYYSTMFKNLSDPSVTGGKIMGGKTGYTGEAGHCLASFVEIEGVEYILVTAGAAEGTAPHITDAVTVYNRLGEKAQSMK